MEVSVIGDAVNLAARVEGQTKNLGPVLITESTHAGLADATRYALREVDRVIVKGRSGAVSLHELTARPRPAAPLFAEALAAWRRGELDEALPRFEGCVDEDPTDAAAALHVHRCRELLPIFKARGLPPDWDGVVRLDAK